MYAVIFWDRKYSLLFEFHFTVPVNLLQVLDFLFYVCDHPPRLPPTLS